MANTHYDFIIIGGGPGGYVAAIRAAQLGYKVACVERAKLGGVCLNWGCIPSKALLANAELMEKLSHREIWGLKIPGDIAYEWDKVIGRSRDVASKLNNGIKFLFKKNKITHIVGHAKLTSGAGASGVGSSGTASSGVGVSPANRSEGAAVCTVEVYDCKVTEERTDAPAQPAKTPRETITATQVIIATGSVARDLPFAKFGSDPKIWGAREAMYNDEQPKSLIVVGSGAIGMEFGYFYHSFGTKVTVVEMLDRILPVEDEEVSKAMQKHFKKAGMTFKTSFVTTGVDVSGKTAKATIAPFKDGKPDESKTETLEADRIMLAIGVVGRFDGLFDDSLGLETVKGHIKTDYQPGQLGDPARIDYKTNLPSVYAIGDVIGPPWLAHVASEEGILCVERIAWRDGKLNHEPIPMDYSVIPGCTYCNPQVASVGLTERALNERGLKKDQDYQVGKFPFTALGKAIATMHTEGFVKIIRGLPRGEILGCHICGDQATELIAEMTLARRLEATTEELICTVHAHPTLAESIHEAAMAAEGKAIHV